MFDMSPIHPIFNNAPDSLEFKKLRKRIIRKTNEAINTFSMNEKNLKWLVCLSGGKDSYTLLAVLIELKWRGLFSAEILVCNLDQGQPDYPNQVLPNFLQENGIPHIIEYQDTYSVVKDKVPTGKTYCSLCSRLRRGILYRIARENGCGAIALGHHKDDILETFFMNLFHGGKLASMPPKLLNDEKDLYVFRPLCLVDESDCENFCKALKFPIIPCNLCGSQEGLQRIQIKELLSRWESRNPGRKNVLLKGISNVNPSHLLDSELFDFANI